MRARPRPLLALAVVMLTASGCNEPVRPAPDAPRAPAPAPEAAKTPVAAPVTPVAAPTPPVAAPTAPATPPPAAASIGSAHMEADGTLVLMLRAEGDGGLHGDALLRYPPDHAEYAKIRQHVGPIEPGQDRPVPPFPAAAPALRYEVSRGHEVLGTIEVRPGEPGTLTLRSDSEAAKKLAEMWKEIETSKQFSISMHMPTSDGSRGAYGSRVYRVGDADYAKAVHWKLLDANYEVEQPGGP